MLDACYDVGFHDLLLSTVQFDCALHLPHDARAQKTFVYLSKNGACTPFHPSYPTGNSYRRFAFNFEPCLLACLAHFPAIG